MPRTAEKFIYKERGVRQLFQLSDTSFFEGMIIFYLHVWQ